MVCDKEPFERCKAEKPGEEKASFLRRVSHCFMVSLLYMQHRIRLLRIIYEILFALSIGAGAVCDI